MAAKTKEVHGLLEKAWKWRGDTARGEGEPQASLGGKVDLSKEVELVLSHSLAGEL